MVEPHANAVFADAACRTASPAAWAADLEPEYPSEDRQELLLFSGCGSPPRSIRLARLRLAAPGVIAGAFTAGSCSC